MAVQQGWLAAFFSLALAAGAGAVDSAAHNPVIGSTALPGSAEASIDETGAWTPNAPPTIPDPNKPPLTADVKPKLWQRLTGDWGGTRSSMEDRGITLDASATLEWSKNMLGGNDTAGNSYLELYNVYITLDTQRLFGWQGGTMFANVQSVHGQSPSDESGVWQATSNLDAGDGRTQVSECWIEQQFMGNKLRLKVGKVDANADFASSATAGEFNNGSFTVNPTIPLPTYPDPAVSISAFYQYSEHCSIGAGLYDGAAQEGIPTGDHSPATSWGKPADLFLIAESAYRWDGGESKRDGDLKIGLWHHTGHFDRFDGGEEQGSTGFYVLWEQTCCRENPANDDNNQGLYVFAHYGYANAAISEVSHALVIGAAYRGLIEGRDDDVAGLGVGIAKFADKSGLSHDDEMAIEAFYKVQITPFFSLKPDLQYVINPGASDSDDALVASLRAQLDF